jgi:glycosyltransferase involved in cell wall biosynthesis
VIRDLPDPTALANHGLARLGRPMKLALGRSRARARVLRRGFDVAHIGNLVYQTDWADLRRLRRRVPLVSDVHDVRPHRRSLPVALETYLLKQTYRSAGHLIVLHSVLRDEVVTEFGIIPHRVHVLPHVLDASTARDPSVPEPSRPMLLFFGTLRANKGLNVLMDALTALGPRFGAEVVIAGAGDAQTMTELKDRLGPLPHVRLEFGHISAERKRELFSLASWVVLPYISFHSQSGVLADAYAYRVPLIVSDVGAIGPTVRDDGTGFVVNPGNADSLADAMLTAVRSTRGTFGAALEKAAHRHDASVVGPQLRAIYDLAVADS